MTTSIGPYEIEREIGRGGMAVVHLARQRALGRHVALKELAPFHVSTSTDLAARFVKEARLAGSLSHPAIVTVHDFFEHDGAPYIAMEYLQRGSLRPYMAAGRLPLAAVGGIVESLLSGLAHAAEGGIAHRDLKPENLLVARDGRVKIADFGIAKAYDEVATQEFLTATGTALGTPSYMAPEQAQAIDIGPWTDLYATGVITFELLTGTVPFTSTSPYAVLMKHVGDPPPDPRTIEPSVDAGIAEWVLRMLAKAPADRPESAQAAWETFEEQLFRLLGPFWRRQARLADAAASGAVAAAPTPPPGPSQARTVPPGGVGPQRPETGHSGRPPDEATRITPAPPPGGSLDPQVPVTRDLLAAPPPAPPVPEFAPPSEPASPPDPIVADVPLTHELLAVDPSRPVPAPRPDAPPAAPPQQPAARTQPPPAPPAPPARETAATGLSPAEMAAARSHGETPAAPARPVHAPAPPPPGIARGGPTPFAPGEGVPSTSHLAAPEPAQETVQVRTAASPPGPRRRRIPAAAGLLAGLLALAAVALALILTSGGGEEDAGTPPVEPSPSAEPTATEQAGVPATFEVAGAPDGLAVGEGAVWVARGEDGRVTRIDPRTGDLSEVEVGDSPDSIAIGFGSVWVTNSGSGTVSKVRAQAPPREETTVAVGGGPEGVDISANRVWLTEQQAGTVTRFDPRTGAKDTVPGVGSRPVAIAIGANAVWVAASGDDEIVRIDGGTMQVVARIPVGDNPRDIAIVGDELFVVTAGAQRVHRIDARANEVTDDIRIGGVPREIAADEDGTLWITRSEADEVVEFDPQAFRITKRHPVGDAPIGVAVGEGSAWIANAGDDTVTRVPLSGN